uniref:Uncharacterized protein n=1 Tax=Sinorhizobium meliloti (strain SM11) TaxID=707241 RepID=Q1WLE4_SINMM|nr:hypothetical protein [Sinorhizobium meliloti]
MQDLLKFAQRDETASHTPQSTEREGSRTAEWRRLPERRIKFMNRLAIIDS